MKEAKFRTHTLPKPLNQFGWRLKFTRITMSAQEVVVQNLVEIDSAVINLRMREENAFPCGYLLLTYPSRMGWICFMNMSANFKQNGWSPTNDCWRQKTRVPGLSRGVVCVILRLAVLIQYRRVTDRQTHDDGSYPR